MFIKVIQGTSTRKFKLDDKASLSQLRKELQRLIGEEANKVNILYTDSDGETITIVSDEDWNVCVEEFAFKNKDKPVSTVTIQVADVANSSKLDVTNQSFSQVQSIAPEDIKEEPKPEISKPTISEDKVIEEVIPTPIVEEKPAEVKAEEPQTRSVFDDDEFQPATEEMTEEKAQADNPAEQDNYLSCFLKLTDLDNLTEAINSMLPGAEIVSAEIVEDEKPSQPVNVSLDQSTLTVDMKKEIESLVDQRVSQILSGRNIPTTSHQSATSRHSFVHNGIFCDGCKSKIVDQPRYKSLVIPDYDLCETCERKGIHNGPMVKFPKPSAHSASRLNSFFSENLHGFFTSEAEETERAQMEESNHRFNHPWNKFGRRRSWIGANRCPWYNRRECSPRRESMTPQTSTSTLNNSASHDYPTQPQSARPGHYNLQDFFQNARIPQGLRNVAQTVAPQLIQHLSNLANCSRRATTETAAPAPTQTPAPQATPAPQPQSARVEPPRDHVDELISRAEEVMGAMDRNFMREFIIKNNITSVQALFESLY